MPRPEQLTLDEKIGQLFAEAGHGLFTNESGWRYQQLLHHIRENKVGGLTWFVSNVYETAWLTEQLQKEAKIPLLISADLEAGVGMRLLDTTFWPPAMAVAATGDPSLAEKQGRITAMEAKVLGINHILAPVADVNVDPDNPVINARSFGEDPNDVARFVAAFVLGVQSQRVLATAKHFPGHGDTHTDSHRSLPVLNVTRERLNEIELIPFRAAIDAGVGSVMIGHLAVPALDDTPAAMRSTAESSAENPYGTKEHEIPAGGTVPATLSPRIINDLLRKELRFDGLVVSDAFDMGALVAHYDAGEAAVQAILAGEDQILKSPNTDAAIAAVKAAVLGGRISESRIDESVRRILAAKSRLGYRVGTQEEIFRTLDAEQHRRLAKEIARRALTLVREEAGALPLRKEARVVTLVVSDFAEAVTPLPDLEREMVARLANRPRTFVLDARSSPEEVQTVAEAAKKADAVVLALAIRARSGAGRLAIPQTALRAIEQIPADVETVGVAFGTPYLLRDLPKLKTYLCAYGIQPVLQVAVVEALFGEAPIGGRLPVTIPGLHKRGEGIRRF
jgi:beta-N-acetylhexosaminidase